MDVQVDRAPHDMHIHRRFYTTVAEMQQPFPATMAMQLTVLASPESGALDILQEPPLLNVTMVSIGGWTQRA